jgi:hypothetical protein
MRPSSAVVWSPSSGSQRRALDLGTLFDLRRVPGYYNPAAKVALLRRAKRQPHDELLVDFAGPDVWIGLKAEGLLLADGIWDCQAKVAGQPLIAMGAWEESCWHREAACDYLELELQLSAGWRLERQMFLARKDRFLFLADALIGPHAAAANGDASELRLTSSLPLATDVAWTAAKQSREGWFTAGGKRRATSIAPALPEWKEEFSPSSLAVREGRVSLEQVALGRSLYAPLWIDLDARRARQPLTWRKLTVAENLKIVPRDVAVAYRVQAGRHQWLFYRSLGPQRNRTFLGENFSTDFVCCRFLPTGEGEEILSIE